MARGCDSEGSNGKVGAVELFEGKCAMHCLEGRHGRGAVHQHADLDLASRDHLDIDAGPGDGLEHCCGDTRVGAHSQTHDRDLGDIGVVGDSAWHRLPWRPVSAARRVSGKSPLATVKLTSVVPPVDTF